jgi:lactate dehydrogenase-like 2-hydroxyacid dehydrogenase
MVFLSTALVPPDLVEGLATRYPLARVTGAAAEITPDGAAAGVRGWLTDPTQPVTPDILDRLPDLAVISQFGVGYDNVDVAAATERGVLVCNTPAVLDQAVSELTIGMILALGRGIVGFDRFVRHGRWPVQAPELVHDVHGAVLGILGMGRIGRRVARLAQALGMTVIHHRGSAEGATRVERDALFRQADFISIHAPLTPETRGSVGARELALMKPSAYLVNTSRGAVVDERALVAALRDGRIAGAALDVMEREPLPAEHELCRLDNVVLLPHVGSATVQTRRAMGELAVRNLVAVLEDRRPETVVNAELLARLDDQGRT